MGIIMAQIHKTRGVVGSILHTSRACHLNMGVIMNMKKIKAVKEAIGMMNSVSGTIAQAIVHVNLTSTGAPLITGKFNRRAALAAELVNVLAALEAEQENNDTRERCGNDVEAAHAEALEINEAVEIAGRVIQAMKGVDIDCIMAGVRGGMYRSGLNDINAVAVMALCVEINRAHLEAFEINAQVDSALVDLAVTIARLPEGADCGRHCINSLEFIDKSYGVVIHPRMLADLVDRASK